VLHFGKGNDRILETLASILRPPVSPGSRTGARDYFAYFLYDGKLLIGGYRGRITMLTIAVST